jgi:HD domain-containing protein
MSLTPEEIEKNWVRFVGLCEKTGDRALALAAMLEDLDERLSLTPASAKRDFHGAFPGGLVDHSLRVLNNLVALNKAYDWKLKKESMIIGSLFHDIGKIGMPGKGSENDFYTPQTDSWRLDKLGEVYRYNDALDYLTTPDRSVFIMQHYGVKLTSEEALAIKLNDGFVVEANRHYCLKITPLVYGVMTADYVATMMEKHVSFWPDHS